MVANDENEKQWTVEDEKKLIFERIAEITEKIKKTQERVNRFAEKQLDNKNNPGIQFNNKIIEISHIFEKAGLEFYRGTALRNPIMYELQSIISKSLEEIEGYAKEFEDLDNKKLDDKEYVEKREEVINQHIERYRQSSDDIFSFDIEHGIVNAIVGYYEENREVWNFITSIGKLEQELQILGYGHLIPKLQSALQEKGYYNEGDNRQTAEDNEGKIVPEGNDYEIGTDIREPVVVGKDPLDINRIYVISLQKTQNQIKNTGQKVPGISAAFKFRLLGYLEDGVNAFTNGDTKTYEEISLKIQNFKIEDEISESIGIYESYWKDVNDFHGVKSTYKEELSSLGYEDKIPEIEQALNENKYGKVVEEKKEIIKGYEEKQLKELGIFTTQQIGKSTVYSPTELKVEASAIEQNGIREMKEGEKNHGE